MTGTASLIKSWSRTNEIPTCQQTTPTCDPLATVHRLEDLICTKFGLVYGSLIGTGLAQPGIAVGRTCQIVRSPCNGMDRIAEGCRRGNIHRASIDGHLDHGWIKTKNIVALKDVCLYLTFFGREWLSPTHIKSFQLTKRPDGGTQRENPGPPIPTLAECIVAHEHPKSVMRSTRNFNEKRVDPTEKGGRIKP